MQKTLDNYLIEQVRILENDRYLCTLFSPQELRKPIFLLLALNSELHSIFYKAENEMMRLLRLEWWKQAIEDLYQNTTREHYIITLLSPLKNLFQKEDLIELIDIKQKFFEDNFLDNFESIKNYTIETGKIFAKLLNQAIQQNIINLEYIEISWELTKLLKNITNRSITDKIVQLIKSYNHYPIKLSPELKFLQLPLNIINLYTIKYTKNPTKTLTLNRTLLHYKLLKLSLCKAKTAI